MTYSPVDGCTEIHWQQANLNQSDTVIEQLEAAFQAWHQWPAPKRGDVVREFGNLVRTHKQALAQLITLEAGKTIQESLGEVQEVIDICDFAVGLSRQLHGLTIASERPKHRMMEQWHPLGPILIISAFNFPMAVWAWNATLALVCGNTLLWKPSEQTPRCAMALQVLLN
ncbi:MAG: aldehyde dehydrogenase family protein, partial [Pseudomonadales bacterium]|nr:aldehyde dehydrogenase family protein [Pseudomonadales bacterium]